jgi:hypothetical protein
MKNGGFCEDKSFACFGLGLLILILLGVFVSTDLPEFLVLASVLTGFLMGF